MEVRLLGSSPDGPRERQYASSYLINGSVAVDAGMLGFVGTPEDQARVRHVFLTHSHMDHIASLPVFLENAWDVNVPAVVLHALPETMEALRRHVFNDVVWPDFLRIVPEGRPFLTVEEIVPEVAVAVEGLRVLPVVVNHVVATVGYIVTDGASTVVFAADTGPTERIWEFARDFPEPRSVFLECTFPDAMEGLARVSAHLTPALFGAEVRKMPPMERVLATHLKHRYRRELESALGELGIAGLEVAAGERAYTL
jgi:ribonuclease BN (tRNA processing enzyme)